MTLTTTYQTSEGTIVSRTSTGVAIQPATQGITAYLTWTDAADVLEAIRKLREDMGYE